jgi:hypothetical protein
VVVVVVVVVLVIIDVQGGAQGGAHIHPQEDTWQSIIGFTPPTVRAANSHTRRTFGSGNGKHSMHGSEG